MSQEVRTAEYSRPTRVALRNSNSRQIAPLATRADAQSDNLRQHEWLSGLTRHFPRPTIKVFADTSSSIGLLAWACVPADYFKSNQAISVKLDDVIWPTNGKNRLPFDRDPVPDTDSGSLSTSITIAE